MAQRCPTTPALVFDLSALQQDFLEFREAFRNASIFYAVKANSHPQILKRLAKLGAGFEIASEGELRALLELGVPAQRIMTSNPVKAPRFIAEAAAAGVQHYTFDSIPEVDKFVEHAPKARLLVRLTVPNDSSDWPLDKKFGVDPEQALDLLMHAHKRGVEPAGIAFHVGSQCRNAQGWRVALEKTYAVWEQAQRKGLRLNLLDVGGGMPIVYTDPNVPRPAQVAKVIMDSVREMYPKGTQVWLEPGRGVVGRAGTMVATVIGVATRHGTRWVHLDVGVFHGLAEAIGGIKFRFVSDAPGPIEPCTIAGPSCDSVDVVGTNVPLPQVRVGDRVVIPAAGAYTTAYVHEFNGMPGPDTLVIESGGDA